MLQQLCNFYNPSPPPPKKKNTVHWNSLPQPFLFCVCVLVPSLYLDLICQRLVVTISYLPNQAKIYLTFWQGFREAVVEALKKKTFVAYATLVDQYSGQGLGIRSDIYRQFRKSQNYCPIRWFFFHLIGTDRARNLMLPLHAKFVSKRFRFLHLPSTHEQKTHYREFFVQGVH